MTHDALPRLLPTGICWCGCGREVGLGSFFAQGHDKIAEGALLAAHFGGSVAQLLAAHQYDDGRSVTAAAVAAGAWEYCPHDGCAYAGTPSSVRTHQRRADH